MKKYFYLFFSILAFFMLGAYTESTFTFGSRVEIYRFLITGFFGLFFMVLAINLFKDEKL